MKRFKTGLVYITSFAVLLFISLGIVHGITQGFLHGSIPLFDLRAENQNVLLSESPMLFWITASLHSIVAMGLIWFWVCYFKSFLEFARNR